MGRKKSAEAEDVVEGSENESGELASDEAAPPASIIPAHVPKKYKVLETKRFSWHGTMTMLHANDIIEGDSYGGAIGLSRLQEVGVKLQEV